MKLIHFSVTLVVLAVSLISCSSGSRVSTSSSSTVAAHAAIERARTSSSLDHDRQQVLTEAEQWIGTPYRFGGSTTSGVDCSGFVCNVYRKIDKKLPRTSGEQGRSGVSINIVDSRPGDLVFFNTSGNGVSHVGILIGPDQFIHASTTIGVTVSSLNEPYYRNRFMFVRRVLP